MMNPDALTDLGSDLRGSRLPVTVLAGLVVGVVAVSYSVSLAAFIFRDDLAGSLAAGVGLALWSTFITGLLSSVSTSFPGTMVSIGGKPAAVIAVAAATIVEGVEPSERFPTVLAFIVLATVFTGVAAIALGTFGLGFLVRYIPFPVVGGFMAATGVLVMLGGWALLVADRPLGNPEVRSTWLPGLLIAAALFVATRSRSRLATPIILVLAPILLHIGFAARGLDRNELIARRWLLTPEVGGTLWRPDTVADIVDADWSAALARSGGAATIALLVVTSLLLYANALESTADRDIDFDQELRSAGWGALLAAAGGGPPAYTNMSATMLGLRIVGPRRGVALVAALLAGGALLIGGVVLELIPTALVGGVLIAIGLSIVAEWVWDIRDRIAPFELFLVGAILVAVAAFGFITGTVFGVVLALVLFVVRYSRIDVIRHELTGASAASNIDRTPRERAVLDTKSDGLLILELRGYLFFGTATSISDAVRRRCVLVPELEVVVFDFAAVTGVDSSAAIAFEKIGRLAAAHGLTLILSGADPQIERIVGAALDGRAGMRVATAPDLDRGIEMAEQTLLESSDVACEPQAVVPVGDILAQALDDSDEITNLVTQLERLELEAGQRIVTFGEPPPGLFFLEAGRLTASLDRDGAPTQRLRTMLPGTVVGEISLYLDRTATANVRADIPSVVWHLSPERLEEFGRSNSRAAAAIHLFVARTLADRVTHAETVSNALRH